MQIALQIDFKIHLCDLCHQFLIVESIFFGFSLVLPEFYAHVAKHMYNTNNTHMCTCAETYIYIYICAFENIKVCIHVRVYIFYLLTYIIYILNRKIK